MVPSRSASSWRPTSSLTSARYLYPNGRDCLINKCFCIFAQKTRGAVERLAGVVFGTTFEKSDTTRHGTSQFLLRFFLFLFLSLVLGLLLSHAGCVTLARSRVDQSFVSPFPRKLIFYRFTASACRLTFLITRDSCDTILTVPKCYFIPLPVCFTPLCDECGGDGLRLNSSLLVKTRSSTTCVCVCAILKVYIGSSQLLLLYIFVPSFFLSFFSTFYFAPPPPECCTLQLRTLVDRFNAC